MTTFIRQHKWQLLTLVVAVALLYVSGVTGPMFLDDTEWVVLNPFVHALTWSNISSIFSTNVLAGMGETSNYYRPFLLVTLLFNYITSGINPIPYHIVNDLIHLANGILIYYLLVRWFEKRRVAFVAALLYLIHPLQTEAVSYIVGRGDPLSVLFILIGLVLYSKGRPWLAGVAMVFAILTRETGILFPAYLVIVLIAFELSGSFWERLKIALVRTLPYFGISVIYSVLRLTVLNFQNTLNFYGTHGIYTEHILYRTYTFFDVLTVYARLMVWPTGLHFDRIIPVMTALHQDLTWLGALFVLACPVLLVWLYKRRDWPNFTVWFFGTGLFFAGLSLSSGIFASINGDIYEHWLYFPLFGFVTIFAWYFDKVWSRLETIRPQFTWALIAVFVAYGTFLGVQTIQRNIVWANENIFYENVLMYEPNNSSSLNNLGLWHYHHGDPTEAGRLFKLAIDTGNDTTLAMPYANLALLAEEEGKLQDAEQLYREAIEINPNYLLTYYSLANLYVKLGRSTDALRVLKLLQEKYPSLDISAQIRSLENAQNVLQ